MTKKESENDNKLNENYIIINFGMTKSNQNCFRNKRHIKKKKRVQIFNP